MPQEAITGTSLRTPRAAAIAGILFSVLLFVSFGLLLFSIPVDPHDTGAWISTSTTQVGVALNLVPLSGVAFLWFVGVIRDRLGQNEDRFFATVFLGSGLMFLAALFAAAAGLGAIILMATTPSTEPLATSATFHFARAFTYVILNVYAIKMAAVFMFSTSIVAFHTRFLPRWIAYIGFALAVILLFGSYYISWSFFVLPVWVLLLSVYILSRAFND
jgi:hypothetical protein